MPRGRVLAVRAACLLALAGGAAPPAARAAAGQQSLVEDEQQMLHAGPAARERALDDALALGADGLRAVIEWRDIAPAPRARRPPAGFAAGDPADYPAARWDPVDDLVRGADARGLTVLLSPSTPIPDWASGCRGPAALRRVCRPRAPAYGAFVRALATRFSGGYADENQGGGVLPRVARWSFANEPNQPAWLRPQFARRSGVAYPAAAVLYRAMARAGLRALRAAGHGGDEILLGETSPIGRRRGRLATRQVPPAAFVRTLLCLGRGGRPLRGAAAAVRRCGAFRRLDVTGFAHHPYTRGGSQPPTTRGGRATEITIASAGRLTRLLDAAAARGRIRARLPLHYTEYGFQTNPPDTLFGVGLARQAEFLNRSDWIAYRNPRVRTVSQYKLADDLVVSSFQSGLRFADWRPKPAYDAYRLALWVARKGNRRLRVYGQVRPAAPGAAVSVELQTAALGTHAFRTVETFAVGSANGTFVRVIARREGQWRLRWIAPGGAEVLSREALAAPP